MNLTNEYPVMIFKSDKGYYSIGLSKKNEDKTYTNGYMPCKFKKDVELDNQTRIYINQAWLSFYLKDGKTIPYVFINDYKLVSDVIDEATKGVEKDEIVLTDDDLPF